MNNEPSAQHTDKVYEVSAKEEKAESIGLLYDEIDRLNNRIKELECAAGSQVSAIVCACGHSSDFHGLLLGKVQCFVDKCTCEDFAPSTPKEEKEEWISVKDRMPESNKPILIRWINDNKKERTSIGFYAAKHTVEYMDDETNADYGEYSEEKDEYYFPEGFHENPIDIPYTSRLSNVTHWMYVSSLPAPPKEAEQNDK